MQEKKDFPRSLWTGSTRVWTEDEDKFILENVEYPDAEIAKQLSKLSGRKISKDALRMRRKRLGVTKKEAGRGKSEVDNVNLNFQLLGKLRYRYNKLQ